MKKEILSALAAVCVSFWMCAKDGPGARSIAIVGKDTLHAGEVERLGAMYAAADDSLVTDSLRGRLIQNWIDNKLILRNARDRGFKLDSGQTAAIKSSIKDKNDGYTADLIAVSLFLPEIENEMTVTSWEAKQYAEQQSAGSTRMSQGTAKCHLQNQKIVQWILDLRTQGGFKVLDGDVKAAPPSLDKVEIEDSTSTSASLLLEQAGPGISDVDKIQSLFSDIHSGKADMDMALLSGLNKLEARLSAPQIEQESQAHLYRKAESVQKVIAQQLPLVQKMFKRELKRNPNLQGQVVVRFVIEADGRVSTAEIAESEISDEPYLLALRNQVKSWKFDKVPAKAGVMTVNYPFKFETDE